MVPSLIQLCITYPVLSLDCSMFYLCGLFARVRYAFSYSLHVHVPMSQNTEPEFAMEFRKLRDMLSADRARVEAKEKELVARCVGFQVARLPAVNMCVFSQEN